MHTDEPDASERRCQSLYLRLRHEPKAWYGIPSDHQTGSWMGGMTRDRLLIQQPCSVQSFAHSVQKCAGSLSVPQLRRARHAFDQIEWRRRCQLAQQELGATVDKVVLARSTSFLSDQGPLDAASLCCAMAQPGLSSVWISQAPHSDWIAATPEILFTRQQSRLQTEALAGTVRAAGNDMELWESLCSCPLRLQEVQLTAEGVVRHLQGVGVRDVHCGPLAMRRFRDWAHLVIPITADAAGISDVSLLQALHPTPAVCGLPREESGRLRQQIEGPTRGWYAGAVGFSTPEWAAFVVVLRCAELQENRLTAWCGVGLVPGFCPEREWGELDLKLAGWQRLCQPAEGSLSNGYCFCSNCRAALLRQ
jgi:menaquinone-specific isochorismate synthase